jgi:monoamine oxidase
MARTTLFSRLRRMVALCRAARDEGITDPRDVEVWVRDAMGRRDAMRGMLGAALVASGCGSGEAGNAADSSGSSDDTGGPEGPRIAIIGGGTAGLHCAHRLREVGVDAIVYESSDRAGGRMYTARGMFPDGQVAELGGEFIDTVHQTLFDLAEEFDIQIDLREDSFDPGTVLDTWWVEGMAVPESTVLALFAPLAPLLDSLVEMADNDEDAYAMLDAIPLSQWLDDNVEDDRLRAILGNAYRGEYGLELDQQSALNLIYLIGTDTDEFHIFGISDERFHTHLGSGTFPEKLAEALEGYVHTGVALVRARSRRRWLRALLRRRERADGGRGRSSRARAAVHAAASGRSHRAHALRREASGDRGARLRHQREGDGRVRVAVLADAVRGGRQRHQRSTDAADLGHLGGAGGRGRSAHQLPRRRSRRRVRRR